MKHKRFTNKEIGILDAQIIAVLKDDYPQSVRHVFYRMTNPRLEVPVEKNDSGYNKVQRRCLDLRRAGKIPYGWISDATRRGHHVNTYQDGGEFLARMAGLYRSQLWKRDDPHVEVWCESRSIAGVLTGLCRELAVSLYPAGGFASATICYEAAEHIDHLNKERAVVLYVGDYDPAGVCIDNSIQKDLPNTSRRLSNFDGSLSTLTRLRNTTSRRNHGSRVIGVVGISKVQSKPRLCQCAIFGA